MSLPSLPLSLLSGWLLAVAASPGLAAGKARRVEFVQEFRPTARDVLELWIPTPLDDPGYQKLVSREITGNATLIRIGSDAGEVPYIYVRWESVKEPHLKIVNVVEVRDREGALPATAESAARYLEPSRHVQTDGIVKETSAKITAGLDDPDRKARAIYDWIVERTARDPETRGCGLGDVKTTLTSGSLKGKCADLNSLFVGLARAAGIPAREVFGQRVAKSDFSPALGKDEDNSKAQHCRAEYYSAAKQGWVPVDPADVRKFILEEKLEPTDAKVVALRDRFFGYWEGAWVAYNFGRDFKLPGYAAEQLNYFMYPLLAAAQIRPDGIDPKETGYQFRATLIN